ncbi:MAG: hypothetical protein VCF25_16200 [Candidatus Poribacteria bacterium]
MMDPIRTLKQIDYQKIYLGYFPPIAGDSAVGLAGRSAIFIP